MDIKFKNVLDFSTSECFKMALYKKSITEDVISYGVLCEKNSAHIIHDQYENVFHQNLLSENIQQALVPLITIDLNSLNKEYDTKLPVFYYENRKIDWIISQLDETGKVEIMEFYDYEGKAYSVSSLIEKYINERTIDGETYYFEEGIDVINETLNDYKEKHFHILFDEEITIDKGLKYVSDFSDLHETWRKKRVANEDKDILWYNAGPYPLPLQSKFKYPVNNKTGKEFYFVTTVFPYSFCLSDITYYIFYDPEERILAQYMQLT